MATVGVRLEVHLNGTTHQVRWAPGLPLLDAMLDNGIDAPHFCREGNCGTCACELMQGRVRMAHPEMFGDFGLPGDLILACQSLPDGVDVSISY